MFFNDHIYSSRAISLTKDKRQYLEKVSLKFYEEKYDIEKWVLKKIDRNNNICCIRVLSAPIFSLKVSVS